MFLRKFCALRQKIVERVENQWFKVSSIGSNGDMGALIGSLRSHIPGSTYYPRGLLYPKYKYNVQI